MVKPLVSHIILAGSLSKTSEEVDFEAIEVKLPLRFGKILFVLEIVLMPFISEQPLFINSSDTSLWPEVLA